MSDVYGFDSDSGSSPFTDAKRRRLLPQQPCVTSLRRGMRAEAVTVCNTGEDCKGRGDGADREIARFWQRSEVGSSADIRMRA